MIARLFRLNERYHSFPAFAAIKQRHPKHTIDTTMRIQKIPRDSSATVSSGASVRKARGDGSRRMYIAAFIFLLPAFLIARYGEAASYFLKTLKNLDTIKAKKSLPENVVSKPFAEPWPEPQSADAIFGNSTRILWGYWHGGEDDLPGMCQLALRSWRARHPDWKVIVVSDTNYNQYVSMSDLPSTFESLMVQHRSDIIRLSLLLRYGGAYMDVSTVALKGLDHIWDTASPESLLLTTPIRFSNDMYMANNALLLSPGRDNLVLREWQRRLLTYQEAPVSSVDEMREHAAFRRIQPLFDDPALGVLKDTIPYLSNLWILMDLLYYDKNLRPFILENVLRLPVRRWTFDIFSLPVLGKKTTYDPTNDPPIKTWSKGGFIRSMWLRALVRFFDDPERAEHLIKQVTVLKTSSAALDFHFPISHHLGLNSTMGRIYRAAVEEGLTTQATLEGAMPIPVGVV